MEDQVALVSPLDARGWMWVFDLSVYQIPQGLLLVQRVTEIL